VTPAAGTRLFLLGDEGILFSEPRQELHALNTTAAVIWCLLEDGLSPERIAASLPLDPADARAYVADALADWARKGLLEGSHGPPAQPPPPGWQPRAGMPDYPEAAPPFIAARAYRLLTTKFRVRFTSEAQFALLHPVLAHLEAPEGERACCFDLLACGPGTLLYRDLSPIDACADAERLVPTVYNAMWMTALKACPFFLNIHAGVVGAGESCILLPAPQGSGKSTLTAALVHAGFEYLSDEVALLSGDLAVPAFPQAICVKESGIAAVASLYPQARSLRLHMRGDGKRVAYLPPPPDRVSEAGGRPVRAVVFPRYEAGAPLASRDVAKTVALGRLLGQCTVMDRRLDMASVAKLVRWIGGLECREVTYGVTAEGVAAVMEVAGPAWRSNQRTRQIQAAK
jgi:hypothetical protein